MVYRLGIDLGSTSLGWSLLEMREGLPQNLIDAGVRIFHDGRDEKSKEPLAVTRRMARGMRRNRDRRILRRKKLLTLLIQNNLMPQDEKSRKKLELLNPYELRARAAHEKISLHELGRTLFQINQRRGFKSNLKTDKGDNDLGAMKGAIRDLDAKLMETGSKTLGEYMAKRLEAGERVRICRTGIGSKASYNFYTGREMYQAEIAAILKEQTKHHPELTEKLREEIEETIFYQRNLLPPKIGKCTFEQNEDRARKASPTAQMARIYQEVNNLSIIRFSPDDPILTDENKKKIAQDLLVNKSRTFKQLRKLLNFGQDVRFSLESEKRDRLDGATTDCLMRSADGIGEKWDVFSPEQKDVLIERLFEAQDEKAFAQEMGDAFGLAPDESARLLALKPKFDDGYGKLSLKALRNILPFLKEGFGYAEAAKKAGYHHSDFRTGEYFDLISCYDEYPDNSGASNNKKKKREKCCFPYYGEVLENQVMGGSRDPKDMENPEKFYGKINNPTVHIALNQLRKLVDEIIRVYGRPDEVVIELARDLKEPAEEINKQQTQNKKENDRINKCLETLGVKQNYRNRMLFKLWEDLAKDPAKRCCPFSGIQIGEKDIFSGKFEEEHLLPFSRSYNDGRANKVLSHIDWNRKKGNRSPYEAFGHTPEWPEILARAQNLPANKQWRFLEDAWQKMEGKDGVIARMLNDTRYMSKMAKAYLSAMFDIEKGKSCVWSVTGQMTALLREKLGLNDLLGEEDGAKERGDHRHHAIDAFVIALTDRGMIKAVSDQARRVETTESLWEKRRKLIVDMDEPFAGFRTQLQEKLEKMVISFKPDHGNAAKAVQTSPPYTVGRLHEDSALGFIREIKDKKDKPSGKVIMAKRVPLESLQKMKNVEEVGDARIRDELKQRLTGLKENDKDWLKALADYSAETGTHRVRLHIEKNANTLIGLSSPKHERNPYKYYATGGNYCVDIFCPLKDKTPGKWESEVISVFDAHQKGFQPRWKKDHPAAKLIMRLQIDDMVAYDEGEKTIICRVKKITKKETGARIYLRPHTIAQEEADKLSWGAFTNGLMQKNARKISVNILGRVKDPKRRKI